MYPVRAAMLGPWILAVSALLLGGCVFLRLRVDVVSSCIIGVSVLLAMRIASYTSLGERDYDASSHIEYILFIAEHGQLPGLRDCGVCGHPPLYYGLAALWTQFLPRAIPLEVGLRALSLGLFFAFLLTARAIFLLFSKERRTLWFGLALLAFWPSALLHAIRIHNDALVTPLMLASLLFMIKWDRSSSMRDFSCALAFVTGAILTKASGLAVAALLLALAAFRLLPWGSQPRGVRLSAKLAPLVGGAFAIALATLLASPVWRARGPVSTVGDALLGSAAGGRYVPPVPDSFQHFLGFRPLDFLLRAETVPTDPVLERFLKSTLFGVGTLGEDFNGERARWLMVTMSAALLVIVAVAAVGLVTRPLAKLRAYRVPLTALGFLLAFLLAFRLRAPNEYHEDFRHILVALVPCCLGYAKLYEGFARTKSALRFAVLGPGLVMVGASILFFLRI